MESSQLNAQHDPQAESEPSSLSGSSEVIGRRIGALLLDILIVGVPLFIVMGILFGQSNADGGNASIYLSGVPLFFYGAIILAYFGVTEAIWGKTLGKRLLGIRVVDADGGGKAGVGGIIARTLLRIIDGLPALYLVGLIVVLLHPGNKRLGDMAGGTQVVED